MKILITGDFCPQLRLNDIIQSKSSKEILGEEFIGIIERADLAITNLECPVTNSATPISKTGPNLKTGNHAVEFLKEAGFDMVTLANNHIMDFGQQGLKDTLGSLDKSGLEYVGAGLSKKQRSTPFRFSKNGTSVSILNFTENEWISLNECEAGANNIDLIDNYKTIIEEKEASDKVIVIVHGGHEMYQLPSPDMKKRYRFYTDAGADAVVGHHPHCVSGYEVYNDSPIFYSIGNFLFDYREYRNSIWNEGVAVELDFGSKEVSFNIIHFDQCNEEPILKTLDEEEKKKRNKDIKSFNKIINDDELLNLEFEKWVKNKGKNYRAYIEPHTFRLLQALQNRGLLPSLWSKRKRSYLLNLVRCESHREILLRILEDDHGFR